MYPVYEKCLNIMKYLFDNLKNDNGYPTLREIGKNIGVNSNNTVDYEPQGLEHQEPIR